MLIVLPQSLSEIEASMPHAPCPMPILPLDQFIDHTDKSRAIPAKLSMDYPCRMAADDLG